MAFRRDARPVRGEPSRLRRWKSFRRSLVLGFILLAVTSCVRGRTEGLLSPPPGRYAYTEQSVDLAGSLEGTTLDGYLVRPDAPGPFPCALLLHGKGGWWRAYIRYAQELASHGITALIVDYYSVHRVDFEGLTSPFAERREQFEAQNEDIARAASDFARSPHCVQDKLGLVGFSLGADKAFRTAARLPQVAAVVAYYGPYDYVSFIKHRVSPVLIALASEDLLRWKSYLEKNSPIRMVNGTRTPALLFHGAQDSVIPVQQTFEMFKALRHRQGVDTRLRIYEGVGHNFVLRRRNRPEREDSIRLVVNFLHDELPTSPVANDAVTLSGGRKEPAAPRTSQPPTRPREG